MIKYPAYAGHRLTLFPTLLIYYSTYLHGLLSPGSFVNTSNTMFTTGFAVR